MNATTNVVRAAAVLRAVETPKSANHVALVHEQDTSTQDDAASIEAAKVAKRDAAARRALNAASDVAQQATRGEHEDERALDARLVFGDLLASAAHKWICFDVGGAPLHFPRTKLAEVGRVLRRKPDLAVTVDKHALRVRWNGGRGGLNLVSRVVTRDDRAAALDVVFPSLHVALPVAAEPAVAAQPVAPTRAKTADEQTACAEPATCALAAPEACVRATTRWHTFQSYREIAELLRPALVAARPDAPLAVDADVTARVRALFGGAASREQARPLAMPAALCACA